MTTLPKPNYDGIPRDLEQQPGLAIQERISQRRWSPRRNRWKEISAFDQRAAELEARQATIAAELGELHERRANAPSADAARLAQWELQDRKGPRPEPQAETIAQQINARQADLDGLLIAVDRTFADKVAYVTRHRTRLQKDADREVDAAAARLVGALNEVAAARADLVETRADAVWAGVFPEGDAGVSPQATLLAGGLRRVAALIGLDSQVQASRIIDALHADADWLKTAATPEQRVVLEGRDPRRPPGTTWHDSEEARAERKAEHAAAVERHIKEWGRPPS